MVNSAAALAAAESILESTVRPVVGEPVAIIPGESIETTRNFVFFYNTVAYIETKTVSHALAGNGPILVERRTGAARMADSSRP